MAHEVAESLLLNKPNKMPKGATPQMLKDMRAYVAWLRKITGKDKWESEREVPLWYSSDNGHVDYCTWGDDHFHVVDLKYGKGIKVLAVNNLQMAIYAGGALYELEKKGVKIKGTARVSLTIYQPRCQKDEGEELWSTWETTWSELQAFLASRVEQSAEIILNEKAAHLRKFAPATKTCQWCPLRKAGECQAYTNWLLDGSPVVDYLKDDKPLPVVSDKNFSLRTILDKADGIRSWLAGIEEHAERMLMAGKPVDGYKLCAGNSSRSWSDKSLVKQFLRSIGLTKEECIVPSYLKSPNQIEDVLGSETAKEVKQKLATYVIKCPGQPKLTPASSPKKEWQPEVTADVFKKALWEE